MSDQSLSKSLIVGFLCATLAVLLGTVWRIGTVAERLWTDQVAEGTGQLAISVQLQKDLVAEDYDRITQEIAGIAEVRSATWSRFIPPWTGPAEAAAEWESLWNARVPAKCSVFLDTNTPQIPSLPKISDQIRSVSGVAEVEPPEKDWQRLRTLQDQAESGGWMARIAGLGGGAVLLALVLFLMTNQGTWHQRVSPQNVRLIVTLIGGIWGGLLALLVTPLMVPTGPEGKLSSPVILACIIGIIIPNLLLPKGTATQEPSGVEKHPDGHRKFKKGLRH
ncbi:MAG TPA: hypothetical protein PLG59_12745 [bacterium]|nr:hypothetical protein [bacterium]HQO35528.1 hypothetical protein [bacterium]HQP96949.1 hypothetical protein [bacterium]